MRRCCCSCWRKIGSGDLDAVDRAARPASAPLAPSSMGPDADARTERAPCDCDGTWRAAATSYGIEKARRAAGVVAAAAAHGGPPQRTPSVVSGDPRQYSSELNLAPTPATIPACWSGSSWSSAHTHVGAPRTSGISLGKPRAAATAGGLAPHDHASPAPDARSTLLDCPRAKLAKLAKGIDSRATGHRRSVAS